MGYTYAIETDNLTRHFDDHVAVEDLSISVLPGSVYGFLGPNGAGKTTTVRLLCALIEPTSGSARVEGFDLLHHSDDVRRRVGMLTEYPGVYIRMTAWENLIFFARLWGLTKEQASRSAERWLRTLYLWDRRSDAVSTFSKGMRQRLAICRALVHHPRVIFLDEPTSGLDPDAAAIVRRAVLELRDEGRTVFLSTHNMLEAEALCDHIAIFATRLLSEGTLDELRGGFGSGTGAGGTAIQVEGHAARWVELLKSLPFVHSVSIREIGLERAGMRGVEELLVALDSPRSSTPDLVRCLAAAGADIVHVAPWRRSLESVYLELLGSAGHPLASEDGLGVIPAMG